jgi:beta-lactamase superfamily II metal-dependent hydrolase
MAACTDAAPPDDDHEHSPEHAEGCGAPMTDPGVYLALPLVDVPPGTFSITSLDVGQGDATVIRTPSGCAALFDGGPTGAGDVVKANLAALGVTAIDVAFLSHFHADHLGSLDEVEQGSDGVPIAMVYDRGGSYTTLAYDQYAAQFAGRRVTPTIGQVLDLCGEVRLEVVAVDGNGTGTGNENGRSVAVKISYGAFDAMIGGDLTGEAPNIESTIAPAVGEIELYRVHHHGSSTSTNLDFVQALRPQASLISVGASNSFGHPTAETLTNLATVGSDVWQTEDPATGTLRGHITLVSATGATYDLNQGSTTVSYSSKGEPPPPGDTTPPTVPTGLTASAGGPTSVDLAWSAASDDVGVVDYLVYRDGALIAQPTGTSHVDGGRDAGATHSYRVAARDAAGNQSALSTSATVTTPCDAEITSRTWSTNKRELTVKATCTSTSATLRVFGDGVDLGPMSLQSGSFTFKKRLAARPACVRVDASCGDSAESCF